MAETLASKVQRAIARQQIEVDRLVQVATVELPAARTRLAQLTALQSRITGPVESLYGLLLDLSIIDVS